MKNTYPNYPTYPFLPISMNTELKHKTIPAPRVLSDDPWFGPAVISDANRDYVEEQKLLTIEMQNTLRNENKEPDNIHEVMYDMSVKGAVTTLDLDPINVGGSENYGDASGRNWNSGG